MGFSVASIHTCCGLRARPCETLSSVARSESPRNKGIRLCVNSRSEHGVRVSGGKVAATVIRSGRRAARTVKVNASAKGRDGWSPTSLDDVCRRLHLCFFEVREEIAEGVQEKLSAIECLSSLVSYLTEFCLKWYRFVCEIVCKKLLIPSNQNVPSLVS